MSRLRALLGRDTRPVADSRSDVPAEDPWERELHKRQADGRS